MQRASIVLLQGDSRTMQSLLASFINSSYTIHSVSSLGELRNSIVKHNAKAVILDVEIAPLTEVERLSHDFLGIRIVCNHRVADEKMWVTALQAGATDLVPSSETRNILAAATGSRPARSVAA